MDYTSFVHRGFGSILKFSVGNYHLTDPVSHKNKLVEVILHQQYQPSSHRHKIQEMFSREKDNDSQSSLLFGRNKDSDIEANTTDPPTRSGGTSRATSRAPMLNMENVNWGETCCGTNNKKKAWAVGVSIVFSILLVILIMSLRRLESTEYGLEYHPRKKELDEAAKQGGLHAGPPGFEFVKFPSTFIVCICTCRGTCWRRK